MANSPASPINLLDGNAAQRIETESRGRKPKCEFCECDLTPGGEVLKFSDKARTMREHDETIKRLNGTIETLRDELERLKAAHPVSVGGSVPTKGFQL